MTSPVTRGFSQISVEPASFDWRLLSEYPKMTAWLQDPKRRIGFEELTKKISGNLPRLIAMFYFFYIEQELISFNEPDSFNEPEYDECVQICAWSLKAKIDMFSIAKSVMENMQHTVDPQKITEKWLACLRAFPGLETDFVDSFILHMLPSKDRVNPPSISVGIMTPNEQNVGRDTVFATPSSVLASRSSAPSVFGSPPSVLSPSSVLPQESNSTQDDIVRKKDNVDAKNGLPFRHLALSQVPDDSDEIPEKNTDLQQSRENRSILSSISQDLRQVIDGDTRLSGLKELEEKFTESPSCWGKVCFCLARALAGKKPVM